MFLNTWLSSCLQILEISLWKLSFSPCKKCGLINTFYFCVPHKSQLDSDLERPQYVGLIIVSLESMDPIILCAVTAFSRYVSELHELHGNFHNISISYVGSFNSCLMTIMPHLRETEVIFFFSTKSVGWNFSIILYTVHSTVDKGYLFTKLLVTHVLHKSLANEQPLLNSKHFSHALICYIRETTQNWGWVAAFYGSANVM